MAHRAVVQSAKFGSVLTGRELMNAGSLGGRLGPLATALGIGAALLAGAATAAADSGDDASPSSPARAGAARVAADRTPAAGRAAVPRAPRSAHRVAPRTAAAALSASAAGHSLSASAAGHSLSASAAGRGLAAILDNRTPTAQPTQTGQHGNVVTGSLNAADADDDRLEFAVTGDPAHGVVTVEADGGYTYTADQAVAATGTTDSFEVAVSDAGSGFHVHGLLGLVNLLTFGLVGTSGHVVESAVNVTVAPFGAANRAPTATGGAGDPDPITGVVTGAVLGTDPDGDVLTYSAPNATAKGAITMGAADGVFTYAPTLAARQNPADLQDGFTVTVADGRGGTAAVLVTVAIAPAVVTPGPDPGGPLAAFPGAEGFGAYATGGRDGAVVYVTNLNAAGPGSLQWAIDQPGARYILFKVSGVIDAQIHLTNGDVTIAGQTSPGGITVRGFVTDETPYQDQAVQAPADFAQNWVLQHIRIRPGVDGPSDDGLRIRYTRNAIVDHVSIGNATDEAIEISYSNNITVQNTMLAETVGGHSFYGGILMNYSNPGYGFGLDNVSLHHNIFNRIEGRLPEGSRESAAAAGSFMNLEMSNNLYWDPRFFVALGVSTAVAGGQPIYWNLNAVNNYFMTSTGFPYGMFDDQITRVARNQLYLSGNEMNLYPGRTDYELLYCCNDYSALSDAEVAALVVAQRAQKLPVRHPFPTITYTPTGQLRTVLLNTAGAWPRDPMDIRLLRPVASTTISGAAPNTNPAADALLPAFSGSAPAAPADADNDGMPDSWELANGLDPAVPGTNARTLSAAGYTDLEVYLQELSASRVTGWV